MKRIFSLILCILLIFSMTVAFAADEKINIDIQPKVKDTAYEVADTAEDLYYAMQTNRSVSACYNFNTAPKAEMYIPKTGDYTVTGFIILGLAALAALSLWSTAKRAKR